jgi:hypothetical protein
MIINLLIDLVIYILGALLFLLPDVTKFPSIMGFDIDTALVSGIGQLQTFMLAFWPLKIMFGGFLFLMGYYALKIGLRFIIGHRAPA